MKIRALIDICGIGYNLKQGEETEVSEELGELLVRFKHVEEVKDKKPSGKAVK